ncbi:MAG: hypothetical protein CL885_04700 [Dehalococcoidia bacterium]|nr:hypothetical protein [Dehalococcoidia bacterium]|tara:strand:- start:398 stop:727 length:330 start_codon:yes stop_codon:yes gene_type:complete
MKKKIVVQRLLMEGALKTQKDYLKQYSILNSLLKTYPNENFWAVVNFGKRLKSLYYLKTEQGKKMLNKKYQEFTYRPKDLTKKYTISQKTGEDKITKQAATTTRRFLND